MNCPGTHTIPSVKMALTGTMYDSLVIQFFNDQIPKSCNRYTKYTDMILVRGFAHLIGYLKSQLALKSLHIPVTYPDLANDAS
jgi:hypothetical protein